ncbi:MAG: hypothetical protein P8Y70_17225 [Candidatus Lokiarchaeota archaeon]
MHSVKIRCPTCGEYGQIEINEDALKKEDRGLLAVNISEELICDHTFIAYIDKNLTVRNYFIPDFQFELSTEEEQEEEEELVPSKEEIDVELIKLNMPLSLLTYIIRVMFFKKKILVITDQYFLFEHYQNFFNYITKNTFKIGIAFLTPEEYDQDPEAFYDFATFEKKDSGFSFRYKFKFMVSDIDEIEKMYEIRKIVQRFQNEPDPTKSLLFLKNDIMKLYDMCRTTVKYVKNSQGGTSSAKKINKYLNAKYDTELEKSYLYFVIDTLNNYFKSNK